MDITIPYYEDTTRISNSNIRWFIKYGPSYLHKMLLGEGEELHTPSLIKGTMIHEYLLQPEEFQKDYVVWDKCRPSSPNEEKFCQELANSIEIEPNKALISAYKRSYVLTNKSDDKVLLEAEKKASTLKDYIDYLKQKDTRTMIRPYDAEFLQRIRNNISNHKAACKILQKADNKSIFHEFHINWEYEKENNRHCMVNCSCKSLLDSVSFSFDTKKVTILDLKTTSHLWNFEAAVNTYDYTRQLYFYTEAVKWYIKNELNDNLDDWTFDWYIIAIDSSKGDIRVFQFTDSQIYIPNESVVLNALDDITWHQEHNLWEHSREYYEGNGVENLNL